ncbi:IgGFc-binding protein-like [Phaenicophaeus curvirostris]|uniref:IgGFc-binding protein-like n=1 Tax=Phaenicophaeus curvirostris TaxID=33595 RepID=UPI0037F0A53B
MGGGKTRALLRARVVAAWAAFHLLCASSWASPHLGEDFAVAFLQNGLQRSLRSDFQLLITPSGSSSSSSSSSTITISMKNPGLRMTLQPPSSRTLAVKIPPQAELVGSETFENVVVVRSERPVSVVMLNEKPTSGDSTVVLPVPSWGSEYFVVTPNVGTQLYGEFAVVAWDETTAVDVHLKAPVTFRGRSYPRGSVLSVLLEPFQALQLQSSSDLSGTRVVAQKPVAVFTGHTCVSRLTRCDHLVEQLQPVASWGTTYLVPPLPFETQADIVYVSTSQPSRVEAQHGATKTIRDLRPSRSTLYGLQASNSLSISSDVGVQVVFFADGGFKGSVSYDPFFMIVPAVSSYCSSYIVFSLEGYENHVVLVAKTSETSGLTLNKAPLKDLAWKLIPGSDYSWAGKILGSRFGVYVVEHETSPFGAWNVGIWEEKSYGSVGVCNTDPCRLVTCRAKETCQVEKGEARCLPDYLGTCLGSPDLEFRTFDGVSVDVPAGCTYTLTKTCGHDPSLEPFVVEEEIEGDSKGRLAKVYVYGFNISIHKGEGATVQVNHRPTALPVLLEGGKVQISRNEGRLVLQTAFGLQVTYDEDGALLVAVPSGYFGATCGLCGNFNEDTEDEMKLPEGSRTADVHDWIRSWRDPTCREDPGDQEKLEDLGATPGCHHEGRSYQLHEEFWEDGSCRSRCRCEPGGEKTCRKAGCKRHEKCVTLRGVSTCRASRSLTCIGTGDPHYTTFDGLRYDFQGTCVYQLAALCSSSDPTLVPFNVTVENNHRGSRAVSFTKTVTLEVYGARVSMSQENPRKVKVNGSFVELPFRQQDHLELYLSGVHGFVRTDFGLRVSFDWYSYARVLLPEAYAGSVCGLCGNANGDPNDDLVSRRGEPAADEVDFGHSWMVDEVPGCSSGCLGACSACNEEEKKIYRGDAYCGVIERAGGPFRACHGVVDPQAFLEDCVFDACHHKGHRDTVCKAVGAYVAECQARGVPLEPWRTPSFCGPSCPLHSHYELCGSSCPATCRPEVVPEACATSSACVEGCFCDRGYLLSGDDCVEATGCGCEDGAFYYKANEVFYTASCRRRCRCHPGGTLECKDAACGDHQECRVENGVLGCFSAGFGQLEVSGDPHYVTFDGRRFHLRGSCAYVLVSLCEAAGGLRNFSVLLEHEADGQSDVTWMKKVVVAVQGYVVAMERGRSWEVTVNGERLPLPLATPDQQLRVGQEGENIVLQASSGLRVLVNLATYLLVTVPELYRGHLCGLGGNFNGDPGDDFRLPNGSLVATTEEFVASWKVPSGDDACGDAGGDRACEDASSSWCEVLADPEGPFGSCHSRLAPQEHVQRCLHDVCGARGQRRVLCRSLQAYGTACQAAGVNIKPWRNDSFCPLSCPPNSHYELCTRTCSFTCAGLTAPTPCAWSCFEGCECDDGFLFDGGACVSVEKCGCLHQGRYVKAFETIISNNCSTRCRCHPAQGLTCESMRCSRDEVCSVEDGTQRCVRRQGLCRVAPGATLTTFDGLGGRLVASGTFKVAALCDERSPSWFKVVVELDECRREKVLAPVATFVFFREAFISINNHLEVWVNGLFTRLPAVVSEAVSITGNVTVSHKSGLDVTFSPEGDVTVSVGAPLAKRLCAPCGNFNGDANDDLKLPGGRAAGTVAEVLDAWKAKDFTGCLASNSVRMEVEAPVYPFQ